MAINGILAVTPNTGCAPFNWLIVDKHGIEHPGKPSSRISNGISSNADLVLNDNEYLLIESTPAILFSKLLNVRVSLNCRYQTPMYNMPIISLVSTVSAPLEAPTVGISNSTLSVASGTHFSLAYQIKSPAGDTLPVAVHADRPISLPSRSDDAKLVLIYTTASDKYTYTFSPVVNCNITVGEGPTVNVGDDVDKIYPAFAVESRANVPETARPVVTATGTDEYNVMPASKPSARTPQSSGNSLLYFIIIVALLLAAIWYWRRHYLDDRRPWSEILRDLTGRRVVPTE